MKQVWQDGLDEENAIVPTSGGGFTFPYGNYGVWQKMDVYEVTGYNAFAIATEMNVMPDVGLRGRNPSEKGAWDRLYYGAKRKAEATEVAKKVRNSDKAFVIVVTQFACSAENVLPEPLEFELVFSVPKKSYGVKNSEQYQLITLPSMVNAFAIGQGWDVPEFGFREISNTKDFVALEGKPLDEYWDKLVLQRMALWKALGETNVKADTFIGAKDFNGEPIVVGATTSEKLSEALRFCTGNWKGFYARVGQAADPSNARNRVPVVMGLYESKEAALAAVNHNDVDNTSEYAGLYFPESFKGMMRIEEYAAALEDDISEAVKSYKAASTGPKKVQAKALLAGKLAEFELTEEQFAAWAEKFGI